MHKIAIRAAQVTDAQALQGIIQDGYAQMLQQPHSPDILWETRLKNQIDSELMTSLVAMLNHQVVGHIVMEREANPRRAHVASLGMGVKSEYQGQGVGSALMSEITHIADNWLNLKRLELSVYTDNQAAIALYEKFDFVIEGEHKAFAFRHGAFVNAYSMARVNA